MLVQFDLDLLIESIERQCKKSRINVKSMLNDCGLGRNVIDNMKNGSIPSIDKIVAIANYFNVSVDYLLGGMDNLEINSGNSIKTGDINGNNNANMSISNNRSNDTIKQKFITIFDDLSPENQIEVMYFSKQLKSEEFKYDK